MSDEMDGDGLKTSALEDALNLLEFTGYQLEKLRLRDKILICFGLGNDILVYLLINLNFYYGDNSLETLSSRFEAQMVFNQIMFKLLTMWVFRKDFVWILTEKNKFLKPDDEVPPEVASKLNSKLTFTVTVFKVFKYMLIFDAVFFALKPWYTSDKELPYNCWEPLPQLRIPIYISQVLSMVYNLPYMVGFDILFLSLCTQVIVQLEILRYKMKHIDFVDSANVSELVERHIFMISFVNRLRDVYSLLFVSQIAITTLTICMELYLIYMTNQSIGYTIRTIVFCLSLIIQFAFYCVPATEVSFKALDLSEAIYDSEWYKYEPKLWKFVLFISSRAQQKLAFNAGGLHVISLETFTYVFKTSISFFTLMRTLKEK